MTLPSPSLARVSDVRTYLTHRIMLLREHEHVLRGHLACCARHTVAFETVDVARNRLRSRLQHLENELRHLNEAHGDTMFVDCEPGCSELEFPEQHTTSDPIESRPDSDRTVYFGERWGRVIPYTPVVHGGAQ